MLRHVRIGMEILAPLKHIGEALRFVHDHHEHHDGTGYPRGLKGEEIPLGARIFAVADTLDAMTSDRPYRVGLSFEESLEEIRRHSGTQFDPRVVEAFMQHAAILEEIYWKAAPKAR
jgi:HD-GYP domain-containing protein (c-di-GMP phosphodiesterase class II)